MIELVALVEPMLADALLSGRLLDFVLAAGVGPPLVAREQLAAQLSERLHLTPAETGVLAHIVAGLDANAIAKAEGVSVATVRTHISHLHDKFGVRRTIDVLRLALTEVTRPR